MRALCLLLLLLLLLPLFFAQGCGTSADAMDKLSGVWRCDGKATLALLEETRGLDAQRGIAAAQLLDGIFLEIDNAAKTLTLHVGQSRESFVYSGESHGGNAYALRIEGRTIRLETETDNAFTLTDPRGSGRALIFKKAEKTALPQTGAEKAEE